MAADQLPDDRAAAARWAERARSVRFATRGELRERRIDLPTVLALAHGDDLVGRIRILWILESLPGARKVDTRRRLAALGVAETTAIADLDPATEAEILAEFAPDGTVAITGPATMDTDTMSGRSDKDANGT